MNERLTFEIEVVEPGSIGLLHCCSCRALHWSLLIYHFNIR